MSDQYKYEIKNNTGKYIMQNQLIQNHRAVSLPANDGLAVLLIEKSEFNN